MPIVVDQQIAEWLRIGDEIIQQVRQIVDLGSGNQQFSVQATGGQAAYLTAGAQQIYGAEWLRPQRNAAATIWMRSGNCQDLAAVAYVLLREKPHNFNVYFCVSNAFHHSFAAIGTPGRDVATRVVIVDPWPEFAQAVRWSEHFCSPAAVNVLRSKPAGQVGKVAKVMQKITAHQQTIDPVEVAEAIRASGMPAVAQYHHRWCSLSGNRIEYLESMDTT